MQDRISIRIDNEVAEALDKFVSGQTVAFKSRQDAYRLIVQDWLIARRYLTTSDPKTFRPFPRIRDARGFHAV